MKSCSIFAGSAISDYSVLKIFSEDYIICADGGYFHAINLGINPDVIIGDFDTFTSALPNNVEILKFPSEKDDTDTMLAIKLALNRGYNKIRIYGALGGRIDHSVANIQSMLYIKDHGGDCVIYGINEELTIIRNEEKQFSCCKDHYVSVFSLQERSLGVSTENLKYELNNSVLEASFPLGISNECLENNFKISTKNGTLLVITQKK